LLGYRSSDTFNSKTEDDKEIRQMKEKKVNIWFGLVHTVLINLAPTTGEQCFAVRAKRTAKGEKRKAKALPCVDARQRAHGNVLPGNGFFAVRFSRTARQRPLPCVYFFAVRQTSLPCHTSLPCVLPHCHV
jgi:hypothetical protein